MPNHYIVYTDGGCIRNPGGAGACAAVVINQKSGKIKTYCESYYVTTNNRMEIRALILGLSAVPKNAIVDLYSDSQYVLRCFSGEWKRKANHDLWEQLDALAKLFELHLHWVKGHRGNHYNEMCDSICTAVMKHPTKMDLGYTSVFVEEEKEEILKKKGKRRRASKGAMSIDVTVPEGLDGLLPARMSASGIVDAHHVSRFCAEQIVEFYRKEDRKFKDYLDLRTGGKDMWSSLKVKELQKYVSLEQYQIAEQYFPNRIVCARCLRWFCRGLRLSDAIRKVLVDLEVESNAKHTSFQSLIDAEGLY